MGEVYLNVSLLRQDSSRELAKFCANKANVCLKPYQKLNEEFVRKVVIAPKYKMLNCIMPKCMSTVTSKIFSYLYDNESYKSFEWQQNGISSSHHLNDFSSIKNFLFNKKLGMNELKEWRLSVFIREPLDRIISAFIDKCYLERHYLELGLLYPGKELCYGCKTNLTCFLEKQYERSHLYDLKKITFTGYEDQHVFPMNWFCSFGELQHNYTIYKTSSDKSGTLRYRDNILEILKSQNVSNSEIEYIDKNIITRTLHNRTAKQLTMDLKIKKARSSIKNLSKLIGTLKNEVLSNIHLYKLFISMYYYDYILFDYNIPLPID
uniref:Carbohydrate sulfotransferase n=1 Tax=Rhabditophanes sp. KR3021 TaxID=114890 RepID=A0AC35TI38_9BILA